MTKPTEAAHFVVYGIESDTLLDALGEDGAARVTEALLTALDQHGAGVASEKELSAALVTGDRAETLFSVDKKNW